MPEGFEGMLIFAVVAITSALICYSIGVWAEKISGQLKAWHLVFFWTGFVFDTTGTTLMGGLAKDGFAFNLHGVSGILAIILMLVHAVWATIILVRNDEKQKKNFHKFSIVVWVIWLIPFISGAMAGMAG